MVGTLAGGLAAGCGAAAKPGGGGNGGTAGTGAGTSGAGTSGAGTSGAGTGAGTGAGNTALAGTSAAGTGAGTGAAGDGANVPGCVDGTEPACTECRPKAEGVYAMKVELDVYWRDTVNTVMGGAPLADPGRGKLTVYFRGVLTDIDDTTKVGMGKMHPCGTELPPIVASANCTAIEIKFPDTVWDLPMVPTYDAVGRTTGFGVGDILTVEKTAGLLGLSLSDPTTFPTWEQTGSVACAEGTGDACFLDQDEDGHPGITVDITADKSTIVGPYACNGLTPMWTKWGAPLSLLGGALPTDTTYAKQAYIGLSTELGGSGKIAAGCESGTGVAATGMGLPSRVAHCVLKSGAKCTVADEQFLDKNTPNYVILQKDEVPPPEFKHSEAAKDMKLDRSPSVGPRSSVIRLGDVGSTHMCADIRGAAFPPFL